MVDPVGLKANIAIDRPIAPVAPTPPVQAAQPAAQDTAVRADPSALRTLTASAAQTPPVDADRVAKIKKAIQEGTFPLVPSTVADRLLALKLEWAPRGGTNDPS
jgi:negative regulator of flagellin synthesis FlgM